MEIEIKNVKKQYRKKEVLTDVTLRVREGSCVGIVGGNGSGKSTLLSILAGVQKADAGKFLWQGEDLLQKSKLRTKTVGYVPQGTPLLEELTANDNLSMWYEKKQLKKELEEGVLAMLGIPAFLHTPVYKMSGGMKKRLVIGCAVAHNPAILLLDEPSAALDLVCKERIYNYMIEMKKCGNTVILATHDVQEIAFCDALYILKNGVVEPYCYDGNIHRLVGLL